ncbi:hypothetical protein ACXHPU_11840 [Vibrio cincinnatiensis]|nr:hypothetical protein [Vibrio cincinnatiensis]
MPINILLMVVSLLLHHSYSANILTHRIHPEVFFRESFQFRVTFPLDKV